MRPAAAWREHRREHRPTALVGEGVVGVAEHRRRAAAEDGGVDRHRRPGAAAQVDQPSAVREHAGGGRARDAGERVDDDVDATPARGAQALGQRRDVVVGAAGRPRHPRRRRQPGPARAAERAAATTRPAPSRRAACTATWPTTPPAPSTSTVSPGRRAARASSTSHAATADRPSAATETSGRSASTTTASAALATASSAMPPSPGAMPAVVGNQTRRPTSPAGPCAHHADGLHARARRAGAVGRSRRSPRRRAGPGA